MVWKMRISISTSNSTLVIHNTEVMPQSGWLFLYLPQRAPLAIDNVCRRRALSQPSWYRVQLQLALVVLTIVPVSSDEA